MSVFGVDYAWGRPGASELRKAGARFACRYLSHDTTGKNLTRAEADQLSAGGLWLVVVWESTASRALSGRSGGADDAEDAAKQARACGMPADRPIYFAVDFDADADQQDAINAYLDGAASVLGRDRVGLYAGYWPLKRAFDAKKITYGWQTYAWSGGHWDERAQLQQYSNGHEINGVGVDYDRAMDDDYGQWKVGGSPKPPVPSKAPKWPGRNITQPPVMHGNDVRAWQRQMHARGWRITVDGAYGASSENVCRAFQREKHLRVDGVVGQATWKAAWDSPVT
ncbi:glycoside hydrolase domain-containing protein [Actinomadura roseirufa]|uniref:glycoside hydrolase domain-containing protein n=1 Tax=Actinomadura roseirufa TaxID=2094049 RepID=UPI001F5EBAF2|nr:glycoside hydrolase domain-containing protein [Actinomadura roseirufa]